jgi:hypothetical protein
MFRNGKVAEQVLGYKPKAALEASLGLNGADAPKPVGPTPA